jgi:hypothetical protein
VLSPDYSKRDYLLPKGCKDLIDVINLEQGIRATGQLPIPWHLVTQDAEILRDELEAELKHASAHPPPVTGEILVSEQTSVAELARLLYQKPFQIMADLMKFGVFATVDQSLTFEIVRKVARKYGYEAKKQT